MGKADKVLEKLGRKPPEMLLTDLVLLFDDLGWEFPNNGEAHQVVRTRTGFPITVAIVSGKWVKSKYLERVRKRIIVEEGG